MPNKGVFTKILAIIGTILVWLPILGPLLFSAIRFIQSGRFLFDYLMPAELVPAVLIGGSLLFWAARRAREHQKIIIWSFAAAVIMLIAGQVLAVVTGLASGETEAAGLPWALVISSLVVYVLSVIALGVGGIRLTRSLSRPSFI